MIAKAEKESSRFQLNIWRGVLTADSLKDLPGILAANQPDVLIVRLDAVSIAQHHLLQVAGYSVIFADALVYYTMPLQPGLPAALRNPLSFVEVTPQNKAILAQMVPVIFKDYTNHYFSNPILPAQKITEGYIEWATDYLHSEISSRYAWLVYKGDVPIGFATCEVSDNNKTCEGVLYGVHPEHAGAGVYTDIIRFTRNFFAEQGFEKMKVSTQLQNYAVQKVWTREGFTLNHAFYTYHLNKDHA